MTHTFVRQSMGLILGLTLAFAEVSSTGAADGSLDPTFGNAGFVTTDIGGNDDLGMAVEVQTDGRIIVAGVSANTDGTDRDFGLARYNPDGSPDTTFAMDGNVTTSFGDHGELASAIAVQADGKIIVAGHANTGTDVDFALARHNPDGSLDITFGVDGRVSTPIGNSDDHGTDAALQPDGKIIVAGGSNTENIVFDFTVACYNSDGSLDETFGIGGRVRTDFANSFDVGHAIIVQPDGKAIVAGYSHTPGSSTGGDFALARYNGTDSQMEVTVDIKPGSQTNSINPRSLGRINVAILSTPEFNALTMIDQTTMRFGRTGEEESLLSCKKKGRDVNHDGLPDLICVFSIHDTGFIEGDTTGILTAQTIDGIAITGQDLIKVGREGGND